MATDFLETLKTNILEVAKTQLEHFKLQAVLDGVTFATRLQTDLTIWSQQHAAGNLSEEDFHWLVESKKDLAEMYFLKQSGIAAIQLDLFVNSLVNVIVSTAISTLK